MKGEGGLGKEHHFVFDFTMLWVFFFFFLNIQCMLSPCEYKYTGVGTYINNYYLYSHAFQAILAFMS